MADTASPAGKRPLWLFGALFAAAWVLLLFAFRDGLIEMERRWGTPEYSHAYLIPFLAFYVLAARLNLLRTIRLRESWIGVAVVLAGLLAFFIGELSALYIIVQYAFLLVLWGLMLTVLGTQGSRVIWASLAFLVFLIPLPYFLEYAVSGQLQIISSELGTAILRLMGVTVFLEGNVIDLGTYKLQVVEACSGLRYLFPLMSFGFLCAVMFNGPLWQRWLIFLSSLPITVFMNSFRIAVTGVLVNQFGTQAAEGFLHYFEGWVIFIACLVLMFLEMMVLARLNGRRLDDALDLYMPSADDFRGWFSGRPVGGPLMAVIILLATGAVLSVVIKGRDEIIPPHVSLTTFPLTLGDWRGVERELGTQELEQLKLTDYTMIQYRNAEDPGAVELYAAYYESQRKGTSAHSPRACLPGSGWKFEDFSQREIPGIRADGGSVPVNRALIAMGENRLLVYYWFMQRGRLETNEYRVKWYIFWDSLTRKRTDGAMVRLITPLGNISEVEEADARLAAFLQRAYPSLYYHIPQEAVVAAAGSPATGTFR